MSVSQQLLGVLIRHCRERHNLKIFFVKKPSTAKDSPLSLFYFTNGKIEIERSGHRWIAKKGDIVILENGVAWKLKNLPQSPVSYLTLGFTPITAEGSCFSLAKLGLPFFCKVNHAGSFMRLFRKIANIHVSKHHYRVQKSSILAVGLLLMLEPVGISNSKDIISAHLPHERSHEERIMESIDYIRQHIKEQITIDVLAKKVVMHSLKFKRLFRKITGVPPHRYIVQKKIEKAKDYMVQFGESPSTTAIELGFHDYSHFFRTFERITGETPTQFLSREVN
jgi:AraC-like DNA-binding protein